MDYREFLRLLRGENSRAVLFEPFPTKKIVTQIIWRGGDGLWDTPLHRAETLVEFYAYIKSDVAVIEPRGGLSEALGAKLPEGMRFVVISDNPDELIAADKAEPVCALATRGNYLELQKPLICLSRENEAPAETYGRSELFDAVYLSSDAEKYLGKKPVLGGIGTEFINTAGPIDIYSRVRALAEKPGCSGWAVGTGGLGEPIEYLGFISMLGMYNKLQ